MPISFSRLIYFTCLHTSLLVQRDHTPWVWSNFFTPQGILPIQFHTRISNFMFQKSTPTLIFLRFAFIHIQVFFYFLFSGLSNTTFFSQAYIVPTTRGLHIIIFSHHIFDLTFRDYCGINLLLGHEYGSHYLYLNLKNLNGDKIFFYLRMRSRMWSKDQLNHGLNNLSISSQVRSWLSLVFTS
jgi:hypothetical protein